MAKFMDLTGQRFSRLTVLERVENTKWGQARWLCRCSCGNQTTVIASMLRDGRTQSCGCLFLEWARGPVNASQGGLQAKHPKEWVVWRNMKSRTTDPTRGRYEDYGLKGIRCCSRWRSNPDGFKHFMEDMGPRPHDNYHLDRIDGDYGYAPWNCRWIHRRKNQLNRSSTVWLVDPFDGEKLCRLDMAKKYGMNNGTLYSRMVSQGWSLEKALLTKVSLSPKERIIYGTNNK